MKQSEDSGTRALATGVAIALVLAFAGWWASRPPQSGADQSSIDGRADGTPSDRMDRPSSDRFAAPGTASDQPNSRAPAEGGCDPRFLLTPNPPRTQTPLRVRYEHGTPLKYVDLKVRGANHPAVQLDDLALANRSTWNFSVSDLKPGRYRLELWGGAPSTRLASCNFRTAPE